MEYVAYYANYKVLHVGASITNFRGKSGFMYKGTFHPRKVTVMHEDGQSRDYYPSVFNLGIKDNDTQKWTFQPEWAFLDDPEEETMCGKTHKVYKSCQADHPQSVYKDDPDDYVDSACNWADPYIRQID